MHHFRINLWMRNYFVNWKGVYTWFYCLFKEMYFIRKSSELKLELFLQLGIRKNYGVQLGQLRRILTLAVGGMINSNMHCHLFSSYYVLAVVLTTLHQSIADLIFPQRHKEKYHHAYFGGEVGGVTLFKIWNTEAQRGHILMPSLSLNPNISN